MAQKDYWAKLGWSWEPWVTINDKRKELETNSSVELVQIIHWTSDRASLFEELKNASLDQSKWFLSKLKKSCEGLDEIFRISTVDAPRVYVSIHQSKEKPKECHHGGMLTPSVYTFWRDIAGAALTVAESYQAKHILISWHDHAKPEEVASSLLGYELASYSFKKHNAPKLRTPICAHIPARGKTEKSRKSKSGKKSTDRNEQAQNAWVGLAEKAVFLGCCVNFARHLTNLPGGFLNPESFSNIAEMALKSLKPNIKMQVSVMDSEGVERERMGLLRAVGAGAEVGPRVCSVHLGSGKNGGGKRYILLGKGVTFDSGGLDIKPASGMRLMKKDMGGAASVLGTMAFLARYGADDLNVDAYLGLAENSVGSKSFRPGDILESRAGHRVEIHNTDAEGRLVLADIMDFALSHAEKNFPKDELCLIDLATLTGAIKVALGSDIPGLFCNDDDLAREICAASQDSGERVWRMPLVDEYAKELNSNFADFSNASSNPFGGAITAALFLKKFTKNKSWAHLDIYAWADFPSGCYREAGATGQGVQLLTKLFKHLTV